MTSAADAGAARALEAARAFRLTGTPRTAVPFGSGHIHDSYSIRCETPSGATHYLLQRLNTNVFRDIPALVGNADLVTRTLREGLERRGVTDLERRCLRCLETTSGGGSHVDEHGDEWRGFVQIEGACSFDTVSSPDQARRAALAFGDFAALLSHLDPASLRLTIPAFHDYDARFEAFETAIARDTAGRADAAKPEIAGLRAARERLARELPAADLAALPVRAVHNDCKLNNVLFDEITGEALCVIDLDTVMPGTLLADFGDLVRTAACRETEDSRALDRIRAEPVLYAALALGYLEGSASWITPAERELLPLAGPLVALEAGLRFLTDHLDGDVYYRVARQGHNLDRARTQLRLTEELLLDLAGARRILAEAEKEVAGR